MIGFFYAGSFDAIITEILNSIDITICASLRETIADFSKKVAQYDFKKIKIDLRQPSIELNQKHLSFFGCKTLCRIFDHINPEIANLEQEDWNQIFLHGTSHTDSYLRNTTDMVVMENSRVHDELRLEIFEELCNVLPRYCLKKYWTAKHADFEKIEMNAITTQIFDRIWIPFCKEVITDEIVSSTEPNLNEE